MTDKFSDKSARVIAVDPSGAARQLLTDTLKSQGFTNVQGMANVKDVLEIMEVEPVDWVITPLMADQVENAMALLKICTVHPQLKGVRISFLLEENEKIILKSAFELGLLSWHSKPFTKDSLEEDFRLLLSHFEQNKFQVALVAAVYLRKHLVESGSGTKCLELEKRLLTIFPGQPNLLSSFAEAQFLVGEKDGAKATLRQIIMLEPEMESKVKEITAKLFGPDAKLTADEGGPKINILNLNRVMIVDSDTSTQKTLKEIFSEIGATDCQVFDDGEAALNFIKQNPNPDLIIQEWRIPKLTGPLFLQSAMAEGASSTPFVVYSSLIKEGDVPFLKEMGIANTIEKPINKKTFLNTIVWTIQQDRVPTDSSVLERKIRNLIKNRKKTEVEPLVAKFSADATVPKHRRRQIDAEWAFSQNEYTKARDFCIEAIKLAGDSILALNLLGKALMMLQDFKAALKCLKKAQDISPLNIERLCAIAEAHTELGETEQADAALNDAKDIDPDSKKVKETEVSIALSNGDTDKAKALMNKLDSLDGFIGYMNNKAVAMARCGLIDEGIEEYRKTIKALPPDNEDLKALVNYNLALAYARASELEEAKLIADRATKTKNKKVAQKAKSLFKRLEKSLNDGSDFKLKEVPGSNENGLAPAIVAQATDTSKKDGKDTSNEGKDKEAPTEELSENEIAVSSVLTTQGEIGCHLIYINSDPMDELSKKLLATLPRFVTRSAISRDSTFGADRLMKAS